MTNQPTKPQEEEVLAALSNVIDPDLHRNIVELGFVKNLKICDGFVSFEVELTTPACPVKERLEQQAREVVEAMEWVDKVEVSMTAQVRGGRSGRAESPEHGGLKQVKQIIAVASGKGGVGKSTVASQLAMMVARSGAKVGLMDSDVYGPSVAKMLGGKERPAMSQEKGMIKPLECHGVRFMSMGALLDKDAPVIWRGPMATRLVQQFLNQVEWGELDYLIIDLPPGTGDVQLTLTQSAPLDGAVIVTTPQEVAVGITVRGLKMFEQVQVPILGIVENMSGFICPKCHETTAIFQEGGGRRAAAELGVPFLGSIPLDPEMVEHADSGEPVASIRADGQTSALYGAFEAIAGRVIRQLSILSHQSKTDVQVNEVAHTDDEVVIVWSDEKTSHFAFRDLRLACPCALCIDEWTGERRLDPATIPTSVRPLSYKFVGRYAVQFNWTDGHRTGLYTFDHLRSLDPKLADDNARPRAAKEVGALEAGA